MRLLLDSHVFLWWVWNDPRLRSRPRRAIEGSTNECFLSYASVWELSIKASMRKLTLDRPVDIYVTESCEHYGFELLPISFRHVCAVERLPWHHRDPFDRLLIAQALTEGLTIVTQDPVVERYGARVITG